MCPQFHGERRPPHLVAIVPPTATVQRRLAGAHEELDLRQRDAEDLEVYQFSLGQISWVITTNELLLLNIIRNSVVHV